MPPKEKSVGKSDVEPHLAELEVALLPICGAHVHDHGDIVGTMFSPLTHIAGYNPAMFLTYVGGSRHYGKVHLTSTSAKNLPTMFAVAK